MRHEPQATYGFSEKERLRRTSVRRRAFTGPVGATTTRTAELIDFSTACQRNRMSLTISVPSESFSFLRHWERFMRSEERRVGKEGGCGGGRGVYERKEWRQREYRY